MRRIAVVALILLLWSADSEAVSGEADGTYTVTVTKVELSQDNGAVYFTVFEGSQAVNVASANAGAVAAGLVSGSGLPPGTYNQCRTTIGESLSIRGYVNNGGTTFYTNNDADGFGLNAGAADTPGGDYATSVITVPAANRTSTMAFNFTCSGGSSKRIRISFDTSGVLVVNGGFPFLNEPSVSITND
ncbi:MAG: DUF4382 domain-containing protein [Candidatus Omnitrophica bacterium]|nr:DUF4382 domain-containing protein [Candidatus Omnitrophota bacterium]